MLPQIINSTHQNLPDEKAVSLQVYTHAKRDTLAEQQPHHGYRIFTKDELQNGKKDIDYATVDRSSSKEDGHAGLHV